MTTASDELPETHPQAPAVGIRLDRLVRPLVARLRAAALPGTNRRALDEEAAAEIELLQARCDELLTCLATCADTAWREAQIEERERCAKVCSAAWEIDGQFTADDFAARVREAPNVALSGLRRTEE